MDDGGKFRTFGAVPPAHGARAHPKDPRHIRPVSGSRNQAADVAQLVDAKEALRRPDAFISQHDARLEYGARQQKLGLQNLPAQLTFSPFALNMATLVAGNNPVLLVPHNTNRYALLMSYHQGGLNGTFAYSFGPPLFLGTPATNGMGIFMPPGQTGFHQYIGQTCPVDDIWVVVQAVNNGAFVVYEGTIALDANQI